MRTFLVAILLFAASSANAQQVAPAPKFIRENSWERRKHLMRLESSRTSMWAGQSP